MFDWQAKQNCHIFSERPKSPRDNDVKTAVAHKRKPAHAKIGVSELCWSVRHC